MDYPKSVPGVGLVGGKFADENAQAGHQGSLIPAAWGNAVTEELLNIILRAGVEPDEGMTNQIAEILWTDPSETKRGMPLAATLVQALGLLDDSVMLTPKKLGLVLGSGSLAANGYAAFPVFIAGVRRLIFIQWIFTTTLDTQGALSSWPVAFPTSCLFAGAFCQNGASPRVVSIGAKTSTTVGAYSSEIPVGVGFIGIGY